MPAAGEKFSHSKGFRSESPRGECPPQARKFHIPKAAGDFFRFPRFTSESPRGGMPAAGEKFAHSKGVTSESSRGG